jgi:23S rRNA 5-hydroxycytidine C2501 synthase
MLPHQIELLSPARDADIGIEAIHHGADAVYIGGPAFGARLNAANSMQDIARLVNHAHKFHARIFLTINTIFRDDELEQARKTIWQAWDAGVDALIVQDMGLLELDLPPIQLHASTQTDIRTPEKARFLQDVGFSQIVMARELTLQQIAAIRSATKPETILEFFVHGALCVAYSGQCYIGEAHVGRSANRGECNQACRLPYKVTDAQGRFIAHDKHVLSMKDNNQSDNLAALIDAGVRSLKIEGRYKDMAYVKNITGHYRRLIDELLEERASGKEPLARASSGATTLFFMPEPEQNFNRGSTDYFVNGRKEDIGAFDTPKHAGVPLGWVTRVHPDGFELQTLDELGEVVLHNGDGLTYDDLQKELVGVPLNRVQALGKNQWRVFPKDAMSNYKDLRKNTELRRNRDMDWVRSLEKKSAERHIGVWLKLQRTESGVTLHLTDEDGISASSALACPFEAASDVAKNAASMSQALAKLGGTDFNALSVDVQSAQAGFVPVSQLNALRRDGVQALVLARANALQRLPRASAVEPPVPFPDEHMSYLGNVLNHKAHDFYTRHGVKVIEPAYEAHTELGEVSLMITKHCVRFSMSLCPKQAKGVTGVQGTVRAEPLMLVNGSEKLLLKFDCKPCEMHVVGKMKKSVLNAQKKLADEQLAQGVPMQFYRKQPTVSRLPASSPDAITLD